MANQTIYTVGGTVQAGGGIYIPRKADNELLEYCRAGEFAFILSSRQIGKSSLMVRTAQQLEKEGIRSVIIDLSSIGVKISADEWYLGILHEITINLNLQVDIFLWWAQYEGLGPAQKLFNFFRDVLVKGRNERVVLFFDEIDSTLSIPFADDFFAALRAAYNARSTVADFKQLSVVMIGVATPSDLIADNVRTPFNIGRRVELSDFTLEELQPLTVGLGKDKDAEQVLGWIFKWTNGHPYLTQRLCQFLAKNMFAPGGVPAAEDGDGSIGKNRECITQETVESAVKDLFLGEKGMEDNNLQFVRDMLLERAADKTGVLTIYQQVIKDKKSVEDDEQSLNKSHLKLSGVVRRKHTNLRVSNLIYKNVFDLNWVKDHLPFIKREYRLEWIITSIVAIGMMIIIYAIKPFPSLYPNNVALSLPICTPESPLVNIYRVMPQSWTNTIFEYAYPPISTPTPPALPPPVNEQQLLSARYAALQHLIKETTRWSDSKTIKMDDNTREIRITLTFISPELLQAVYLNEVLKDRFLTFGFQDQLQGVLNGVAERNELLFLLTVTATNNNVYSTRHTIRIPIQEMVMQNAEKITIIHSHNDRNLEQIIDTSSGPVFGYLGYPISLVSADQCKWVLDPKYNKNITVTIPFVEVNGKNNKISYFWTIPYAPLLDPNLPSDIPNFNMPTGFDTNLMSPLATPPSDMNQANYWPDFARFVWGQITLGNR